MIEELKITPQLIIEKFPIAEPFKFIGQIISIDERSITGSYTFDKDAFFYKGHFINSPVTPGSIVQESAAQIGLVAFGMYLLGNGIDKVSTVMGEEILEKIVHIPAFEIGHLKVRFYLVSSDMIFKKIVLPGDTIFVHSQKIHFRLNKLKCDIKVLDEANNIIAKGIMSGMVNIENTGEK
ncbi:MAG: hypothetical protein LBE82_00225 [Chitinophagaceae bacterium]|jgi:3-hydroxyacyl-[acyl-carrier-protein] dehydratase|nr:hypothetical protein [Chitinophagaceae bacterium]